MRADALVGTQLLMAQAINALAEHVNATTGFIHTPVKYADLPNPPLPGMTGCVSDSSVSTWGAVVTGGGSETVLVLFNGSSWTVAGA